MYHYWSHVKYTPYHLISLFTLAFIVTTSKKMSLNLLFLPIFFRLRGNKKEIKSLMFINASITFYSPPPSSIPNTILGWFTSQLAHSYSHISTAPPPGSDRVWILFIFLPIGTLSNPSQKNWIKFVTESGKFHSLNRQKHNPEIFQFLW